MQARFKLRLLKFKASLLQSSECMKVMHSNTTSSEHAAAPLHPAHVLGP